MLVFNAPFDWQYKRGLLDMKSFGLIRYYRRNVVSVQVEVEEERAERPKKDLLDLTRLFNHRSIVWLLWILVLKQARLKALTSTNEFVGNGTRVRPCRIVNINNWFITSDLLLRRRSLVISLWPTIVTYLAFNTKSEHTSNPIITHNHPLSPFLGQPFLVCFNWHSDRQLIVHLSHTGDRRPFN